MSVLQVTAPMSCQNSRGQCSTFMTMCQIAVVTSDGCVMKTQVLIDWASSTSFIMERLAQRPQLPGQCQHVWVTGIGGPEYSCVFVFHGNTHWWISESWHDFWTSMEGRSCSPSTNYDWIVSNACVISHEMETCVRSLFHRSGVWFTWIYWHIPRYWHVQSSSTVCQGRHKGPLGSLVAFKICFAQVLFGQSCITVVGVK